MCAIMEKFLMFTGILYPTLPRKRRVVSNVLFGCCHNVRRKLCCLLAEIGDASLHCPQRLDILTTIDKPIQCTRRRNAAYSGSKPVQKHGKHGGSECDGACQLENNVGGECCGERCRKRLE